MSFKSIIAIFALSAAITAAPVSLERASRVAENAAKSKRLDLKHRSFKSRSSGAKSAGLARASAEDALFYVFQNDGGRGFVIVAGDDAFTPIIGISDKGTYDPDGLPPNFAWYIENIEREMAFALENGQVQTQDIREEWALYAAGGNYAAGDFLVKTQWNQYDPYSGQTPLAGGKRTVTGCVATAVAQIVNYHRYPARASDTIPAYTTKPSLTSLGAIQIPALSPFNFDWNNMANTYTATSTTAQKNAVAALMNAVGRAIETNYDTTGSPAYSEPVASALMTYFRYDYNIQYMTRGNNADWVNLLKGQIDNGLPVYYSGSGGSNNIAHAFVLDGYDNSDRFHVNWGWGGVSDGFYAITVGASGLKPSGSSSYYGYDQKAVINIKPPPANSPVNDLIYYATVGGTYTLPADIAGAGKLTFQLNIRKNLTLDLNGRNLTIEVSATNDNGIKIAPGKTFTVRDGRSGGVLNVTHTNKNTSGAGAGAAVNTTDGTLIIESGTVNAASGRAAGIGGGYNGAGGNITIRGGTVTAIGGNYSAGIGGGYHGAGGRVAISGGTVTATGGSGGAGIGGGYYAVGAANVTISGGKVTATGGSGGAGIGGGDNGVGGTVTVDSGTVKAVGGSGAAGIGGGQSGSGDTVKIRGGAVTATGGRYGAGIGGGQTGNGGTITVSGGTTTADGGDDAAGIGGGYNNSLTGNYGNGGRITVSGGAVTATGGSTGAGIGGGYDGAGGAITITNGTVTATGGKDYGGAGIGGGLYAAGGTIAINGGSVNATGGSGAKGVGGGQGGTAGTFTMNGSALVFANSVSDASAKTGGILVIGDTANYWYGNNSVTLSPIQYIIPAGKTLTIPAGKTLTVPAGATIANQGRITPANSSTVNLNGTRTGNLIDGANTATPKPADKTATGITVSLAAPMANTKQTVEYAVNTANTAPASGWQTGTAFTNLNGGTTYYIFARTQANTNFAAGTPSVSAAPVKTMGIPAAADLSFAIPSNHVYTGEPQGFNVSAAAGMGAVTVYYSGSRDKPVNAGTYIVTVDVAGGDDYVAKAGISIGNYTVAKADPAVTWPTGLSAAKGSTLAGVPLGSFTNGNGPAGTFSWAMPDTPVDEAVARGYDMTFTPVDGANYNAVTKSVTVETEVTTAVASSDRTVPAGNSGEAAVAAVTPAAPLTGELAAGPNPAGGSFGVVNFFRQGKRIESGALVIYGASGNVVRKVNIVDDAGAVIIGNSGKRVVGSWDLTDSKGRRVPVGTYLAKGEIIAAGGKGERVAVIIGVR